MDLFETAISQGIAPAIVVAIYLIVIKIIDTKKEKNAIKTVFIYLISERIYFWWGICDRYTDEEKICRSISLDRRK